MEKLPNSIKIREVFLHAIRMGFFFASFVFKSFFSNFLFEEFMYYVVHNGTCNRESFIYLRISFSKLFMGFFSIISFNIPNKNLLIKDFFNTKRLCMYYIDQYLQECV